VAYFIISILYLIYYFFIRKNYRYIEDHTKEEECLRCNEANCSKKQINIPTEYLGPTTLYNEKIKIKSNLELIEDHIYNLKPNYVVDVNDSTLNQENDVKTISNNTQKSGKSYYSNVSNDTYVNSYDEKYTLTKSFNKLYGIGSDSLSYQYGSYGNTRVHGGKIKSNKVIDSDKSKYIHKSISKNNDKQMQNYISFNKVFKERSHCTCECHNKEYTKVRVKFKPFDLISKNNHEFIYWSFFVCLEINTVMVILFGLFSVFPE